MGNNSWIPFAGTALGAVIALAGTLLAGVRNDRSRSWCGRTASA